LGKALVVYDSVYGNTEKVARALAKGLEDGGVDVDCVRVDAAKFDEVSGYDLLVVGGPVHSWSYFRFLESITFSAGKTFPFDLTLFTHAVCLKMFLDLMRSSGPSAS
jgi:flavodoxin